MELEKAKKLLEEKYNTQLDKIKKEFQDKEEKDLKIKRVIETHVEDSKHELEVKITIEKEKHEIEVKTEEVKQKLEDEKKKNDILLENKK